MNSNSETGCVKTLAILSSIATILGVFIALLAWIMPFSPVASSPLNSPSTVITAQQTPTTTFIQSPFPTYTSVPAINFVDLAGSWKNPDTNEIYTIEWQNDRFVVVSSIDDDDGEVYIITSQNWQDGFLTWTFYVPSTKYSVTYETVSFFNDQLECHWFNSANASGTVTLQKIP